MIIWVLLHELQNTEPIKIELEHPKPFTAFPHYILIDLVCVKLFKDVFFI